MTPDANLRLEVRHRIAASPERLFAAWTTPEQLLAWWGPKGVRCTETELQLVVGGRFRLGNELPDGQVIFIVGEYLSIEPPSKLVYTWSIEGDAAEPERVTVSFNRDGAGTEIVILHELILMKTRRDEHSAGWNGCLDKLETHVLAAA